MGRGWRMVLVLGMAGGLGMAAGAQDPAHPKAHSAAETDAAKAVYAAYQDPKTSGAKLDGLIEGFQAQYPSSDYRAVLAEWGARFYQTHGNYPRFLAYGEQVLRLQPDNLYALMAMGAQIPENVTDADLDREPRLDEAAADDRHLIALFDAIQIDPVKGGDFEGGHYSTEQITQAKTASEASAYSSLGRIAMLRQQYGAAVEALNKAVTFGPAANHGGDYLRLAQAEEGAGDVSAATAALDKAAAVAAPDSAFAHQVAAEKSKVAASSH